MRKFEWSKFLTFLVGTICIAYAVWSGIRYYELCELAILNDGTMPDASLPIAGITGLLGSVFSYLTYQVVLKSSLNKHNLRMDKTGVVRLISDGDIHGVLEKVDEAIENSEELEE